MTVRRDTKTRRVKGKERTDPVRRTKENEKELSSHTTGGCDEIRIDEARESGEWMACYMNGSLETDKFMWQSQSAGNGPQQLRFGSVSLLESGTNGQGLTFV